MHLANHLHHCTAWHYDVHFIYHDTVLASVRQFPSKREISRTGNSAELLVLNKQVQQQQQQQQQQQTN